MRHDFVVLYKKTSLENQQKRTNTTDSRPPTVFVCLVRFFSTKNPPGTGISACEKGCQWQRGLGVLAAMLVAKILPNVISFSAAIGACEKAIRGRHGDRLALVKTALRQLCAFRGC